MLKVVKPHHYSKKEKFRALSGQTIHGQFWRNTAEVRDMKTWSG